MLRSKRLAQQQGQQQDNDHLILSAAWKAGRIFGAFEPTEWRTCDVNRACAPGSWWEVPVPELLDVSARIVRRKDGCLGYLPEVTERQVCCRLCMAPPGQEVNGGEDRTTEPPQTTACDWCIEQEAAAGHEIPKACDLRHHKQEEWRSNAEWSNKEEGGTDMPQGTQVRMRMKVMPGNNPYREWHMRCPDCQHTLVVDRVATPYVQVAGAKEATRAQASDLLKHMAQLKPNNTWRCSAWSALVDRHVEFEPLHGAPGAEARARLAAQAQAQAEAKAAQEDGGGGAAHGSSGAGGSREGGAAAGPSGSDAAHADGSSVPGAGAGPGPSSEAAAGAGAVSYSGTVTPHNTLILPCGPTPAGMRLRTISCHPTDQLLATWRNTSKSLAMQALDMLQRQVATQLLATNADGSVSADEGPTGAAATGSGANGQDGGEESGAGPSLGSILPAGLAPALLEELKRHSREVLQAFQNKRGGATADGARGRGSNKRARSGAAAAAAAAAAGEPDDDPADDPALYEQPACRTASVRAGSREPPPAHDPHRQLAGGGGEDARDAEYGDSMMDRYHQYDAEVAQAAAELSSGKPIPGLDTAAAPIITGLQSLLQATRAGVAAAGAPSQPMLPPLSTTQLQLQQQQQQQQRRHHEDSEGEEEDAVHHSHRGPRHAGAGAGPSSATAALSTAAAAVAQVAAAAGTMGGGLPLQQPLGLLPLFQPPPSASQPPASQPQQPLSSQPPPPPRYRHKQSRSASPGLGPSFGKPRGTSPDSLRGRDCSHTSDSPSNEPMDAQALAAAEGEYDEGQGPEAEGVDVAVYGGAQAAYGELAEEGAAARGAGPAKLQGGDSTDGEDDEPAIHMVDAAVAEYIQSLTEQLAAAEAELQRSKASAAQHARAAAASGPRDAGRIIARLQAQLVEAREEAARAHSAAAEAQAASAALQPVVAHARALRAQSIQLQRELIESREALQKVLEAIGGVAVPAPTVMDLGGDLGHLLGATDLGHQLGGGNLGQAAAVLHAMDIDDGSAAAGTLYAQSDAAATDHAAAAVMAASAAEALRQHAMSGATVGLVVDASLATSLGAIPLQALGFACSNIDVPSL